MHKSEQITDAVYSSFQESELKNQIASLGGNGESEAGLSDKDIEKIAQALEKVLKIKYKSYLRKKSNNYL